MRVKNVSKENITFMGIVFKHKEVKIINNEHLEEVRKVKGLVIESPKEFRVKLKKKQKKVKDNGNALVRNAGRS